MKIQEPAVKKAPPVERQASGGGPIHLKRMLRGLPYDQQVEAVKPAEPVQLKSESQFSSAVSGAAQAVPYQSEMESAFGQSFGNVQAYTGRAGDLSPMGAEAATRGEKVAFSTVNPSKELVAHELTHVVQERQVGGSASLQAKSGVSSANSAAEREADSVASAVAGGQRVQVREKPGAGIQLKSGGGSSGGGVAPSSATPGAKIGAWEKKVKAKNVPGWGQFKSKLNLKQYKPLNTSKFKELVAEYIYKAYYGGPHANLSALAVNVNAYMKSKANALHTDENGVFFWSGTKDIAAGKAKSAKGKTLEMTMGGSLFDGLTFGTAGYADWTAKLGPLWDELSRYLAQGSKGKVQAHQYIGIRQGSVFERVELPELEKLIASDDVDEVECHIYYRTKNGKDAKPKFHHKTNDIATLKSNMWLYGKEPNGGWPPGVKPGTPW